MSSVQVTATVEAGNVPPRVRLDVVDSTGTLYTAATITRLDPDQNTVPVRTSDGNPLPLTVSGSSTVGLLYDYEMPYGEQVVYSSVESPDVTAGPVQVDAAQAWLVHPGVPSLSMPVNFRPGTLQQETLTVQQGVFYPMGRDTPIVVNDGARKASKSSLIVSTESPTEAASLRALVKDAGVLLLNLPADGGYEFDTCYIAVQDISVARFTDVAVDSYRDFSLPFVVVSRPAGGSTSARTLIDLLAEFPTLAAIQSAYGTLNDVLAGP